VYQPFLVSKKELRVLKNMEMIKKGRIGDLFDLRFLSSLLYRGDILWTFPKFHDVVPGFPGLPHFMLQFQTLTDFLKPI
jgi:hypothetical protein